MSTSPHLISLTANNWHGTCYIQGRDKLSRRNQMELSFSENFALLIFMIKEGGEDARRAEDKLLKFAEAMDEVAKEQENAKKD